MRKTDLRTDVLDFYFATNSVTPASTGEALAAVISNPFEKMDNAVEILNRFRHAPADRIRVKAAIEAATLLLVPVLPILLSVTQAWGWTLPRVTIADGSAPSY
ncbi:hypothetical protein OKW40_001786 [Paraburkholderia sp. RAU6.4a]|uniref:hypothetical protein n=1 Tax=Paraburkholderia sp. RAU6.4a TaxID=2991067 RepID=UPI003D1965CE